MRPITKHRALNFDNNNLSDFITKKKPKKKSIPMRRVNPVDISSSPKPVDNPFAVEEVTKSPSLDDDRQMLKEIRMLKSPKKAKKCPNLDCPFTTEIENVQFDESVIELGLVISKIYTGLGRYLYRFCTKKRGPISRHVYFCHFSENVC